MPKVYIVNSSHDYEQMFIDNGWTLVDKVGEADLVQFTGGEDVSPDLYGEHKHPQTYSNRKRDDYEIAVYDDALIYGVPVAGICRGGQFLNVMNGGRMIQHVEGHAIGGTHTVFTEEEGFEEVQCSSTHHQMMVRGREGMKLGTAEEATMFQFMDEEAIIMVSNRGVPDTEIVLYEDTKSLCFQPHPEFFNKEHECQRLYFHLINKYLLGE